MKSFLFFILIINFKTFSQSYNFDEAIQFKDSVSQNIEFFLINNKENHYYFHASNHGQDSIYGSILDFKTGKLHTYAILNLKDKISFEYKKTSDLKFKNSTFNSYSYKEKRELTNDNKLSITFFAYRNEKMKKSNLNIKIKTMEKEINVNEYFLNLFTHGYFLNTDFKATFGFPHEITVTTKNKIFTKYSIIERKSIETQLRVL